MLHTRRTGLIAVFAALLTATAGCSPSVAPAMGTYVDVSGTVKLADGTPLKSGVISFAPQSATEGRDGLTMVTNGEFKLKLFVGKYKAALDVEVPKPRVPAKYTKFASSDLTADVTDDAKSLAFVLK